MADTDTYSLYEFIISGKTVRGWIRDGDKPIYGNAMGELKQPKQEEPEDDAGKVS